MRDTSKVGNISTAQVLAALIRMGKFVLLPFGEGRRYDLAIEEDDGRMRPFPDAQHLTALTGLGTQQQRLIKGEQVHITLWRHGHIFRDRDVLLDTAPFRRLSCTRDHAFLQCAQVGYEIASGREDNE